MKRNILNIILQIAGVVLYTGTTFAQPAFQQIGKNVKKSNLKEYISADLDASFQAGNRRNIGTLNFFLPIGQTDETLLFVDARLMGDSTANKEGNLGLIYRKEAASEAVIGGGPFVDVRKSSTGNTFPQLTLNLHVLTPTWQIQGNIYCPSSKRRVLATTAAPNPQIIPMQGYVAAQVTGQTISYERALPGTDLNISYAHPNFSRLRVYASAYRFAARGFKPIQGLGQKIEYRINDFIKLNVEHARDVVRKTQLYMGAVLTIPLNPSKKSLPSPSPMTRLFETRVIRDIDAVTAQNKVEVPKYETFNAIFVSSTAPAGGDGTAERPFQSIDEAAKHPQAKNSQIVYLTERGDAHLIEVKMFSPELPLRRSSLEEEQVLENQPPEIQLAETPPPAEEEVVMGPPVEENQPLSAEAIEPPAEIVVNEKNKEVPPPVNPKNKERPAVLPKPTNSTPSLAESPEGKKGVRDKKTESQPSKGKSSEGPQTTLPKVRVSDAALKRQQALAEQGEEKGEEKELTLKEKSQKEIEDLKNRVGKVTKKFKDFLSNIMGKKAALTAEEYAQAAKEIEKKPRRTRAEIEAKWAADKLAVERHTAEEISRHQPAYEKWMAEQEAFIEAQEKAGRTREEILQLPEMRGPLLVPPLPPMGVKKEAYVHYVRPVGAPLPTEEELLALSAAEPPPPPPAAAAPPPPPPPPGAGTVSREASLKSTTKPKEKSKIYEISEKSLADMLGSLKKRGPKEDNIPSNFPSTSDQVAPDPARDRGAEIEARVQKKREEKLKNERSLGNELKNSVLSRPKPEEQKDISGGSASPNEPFEKNPFGLALKKVKKPVDFSTAEGAKDLNTFVDKLQEGQEVKKNPPPVKLKLRRKKK